MFVPLLCLAAPLAHLPQAGTTVEILSGISIGGLGGGGRTPVGTDAIQAAIIYGKFTPPHAGDKVTTARGERVWRDIKANKDGVFEGQISYIYAEYDSPTEETRLLDAAGDSLVYVNGELRGGDPYSTKYLKLPVRLKRGRNSFLFSVGRGSLRARLLPISSPLMLDTGDVTIPDTIPSDRGNLMTGIVVLNNTAQDATDLTIKCVAGHRQVRTKLPRVPAMSLRKVRFDMPAGEENFDVTLYQGDQSRSNAKVTIRNLKGGEVYRRTFESAIDGSVQYYAVNPSTHPDPGNALILSLHGASVEGLGQAQAYKPKDWSTLVAPTNRRPYGFDWEDWGRMDGIEVLDQAIATIPHDPKRVVVTGHSMGGHGTWSLGTMYPQKFGATAPSAAWISFWSYGGGWTPTKPTECESMLFRAMAPSDTLARVFNLTQEKVYVLHGQVDDNVPVSEAREMKKTLTDDHIPFGYHEEPGASHWWGPQCVDYPELMDTLKAARISDFRTMDFTTPDPAVSNKAGWIEILQQIHPRQVSHLKGSAEGLATENVLSLKVDEGVASLRLDGNDFKDVRAGTTFVRGSEGWKVGRVDRHDRTAEFSGPIKQALKNRLVLVYGTTGNAEENLWSRNKARYDAETFYYRGNGALEVVSDAEYLAGGFRGRNVLVYGNADTNRVWKERLAKSPIQVRRGSVKVGPKEMTGDGLTAMFVYPSGNELFVAIGGSDMKALRMADRLPVFASGTAFPDWLVLGPDAPETGTKALRGAGFFGPDWSIEKGDSAWSATP